MKKRFLITLFCLIFLIQLMPIVPMAETTGAVVSVDKGTVSQDLYYCRDQLAQMPNGVALVAAYNNIINGVNHYATEIEINLSKEEFYLVLDATRRDHTEQFWLESQYGFTFPEGDESKVLKMKPKYTMPIPQINDARSQFESRVQDFLGYLNPDMSDYEKVKTLHDMLAINVDYVSGAANSHNAYGALVEKKAVCEGYAESLQYLLQRVGIPSIEVFGYGISNVATGKGENHAWNIVFIDGVPYLIDLTWDDKTDDGFISYAYFNQTSEIFDVDHKQWVIGYENGENWDGGFALPECTSNAENLYVKSGLSFSEYSIASIGALLKKNNLSVTFWIESDPTQFQQWFMQKGDEFAFDLAREAGVSISSPFSRSCLIVGREVKIEIVTCQHKALQQVAAKPATCTEDGNTAYYVCQNKECEKWFSDAEAKSEILNKDLVKVIAFGHAWERREDAAAHKEGESYWYTCSTCGTISDTLSFSPEPEPVETSGWDAVLQSILSNPLLPLCIGGAVVLIVILIVIAAMPKAKK